MMAKPQGMYPIEKLVEMYLDGMDCAEIGRTLGCSRQAVHYRLINYGVIKPRLTSKSWSPTDIHILRENYPMHAAAGAIRELAKAMGKSYSAVCVQAAKLGLKDKANKGRPLKRNQAPKKRK